MLRDLAEYLLNRREELHDSRSDIARRAAEYLPGFTARQVEIMEKSPAYLPESEVLRAVAKALAVPYLTLLAKAGYLTSDDLENISLVELLNVRYGIHDAEGLAKSIQVSIVGQQAIERGEENKEEGGES